MWTSQKIRQLFLDYFTKRGHMQVSSSGLIPENDPTLLFTNAGMVPFKNVFLGIEQREYIRATSSQRCLRAGGKHNDLEQVGYTARHHTFFEMLGNFSFGDYFKREAIQFAWDFITKELAIPAEKLWVTVYQSDEESAQIWLDEIKINPERFSRCGEADNFWRMGDTGPCGPCTEIFYDHGAAIAGGPPGSADQEGDRFIEIWNLVFMQYDCDAEGTLKPLPAPAVDTGMGLERLTAVMQGVHTNYETDLFLPMIKVAAQLANTDDLNHRSLRVIADHIRATAFLILDGVLPGNEGRSYVLRRIIRRAVRHGYLLGIAPPFFGKLLVPLSESMANAYPALVQEQAHIATVIEHEEKQFAKTLNQGMRLLTQVLADLSTTEIPGDTVFKLYDTYGFPTDLTADIAREQQLTIDWQGFDAAMEKQRQLAKQAGQFAADYHTRLAINETCEFAGYTALDIASSCLGIYTKTGAVKSLAKGESGLIVLKETPFYPEGGGQVGDTGIIKTDTAVFTVTDTQKQQNAIVHHGKVLSGQLSVGDQVQAQVDENRRGQIALNHSATHLLHAALQKCLGHQVVQKGSLVAPDKLRFDFSFNEAVTTQQLLQIERQVNQFIRQNYPINTQFLAYDEAIKRGAMALFSEKYSEEVRVLTIGEVSIELCGGTHAKASGEIGLFKILSETGIAAGIRRIEAVTGQMALEEIQNNESLIGDLSQLLSVPPVKIIDKVNQLQTQLIESRRQLEQLQQKIAYSELDVIRQQARKHGELTILAAEIPGVESKFLRPAVEQCLQKLPNAIVVLATTQEGRVSIVAGIQKALSKRFNAGKLVNHVANQVGGKGGGKPELAQAGGNQPENLSQALASIEAWVTQCQA